MKRYDPIKVQDKLQPIVDKKPMYRLVQDLVDLSSLADANENFRYIQTVIDPFSKWGWAYPLHTKDPVEVVDNLVSIFRQKGAPKILQCDNGGEFIQTVQSARVEDWGIKLIHSSPRCPQTNGAVERWNQTQKLDTPSSRSDLAIQQFITCFNQKNSI